MLTAFLLTAGCAGAGNRPPPADDDAIRPYTENPRYWQYRGEPVLLLGGSDEDNLFNHPDLPPAGLEAQLDLLVSTGGNYVRNTMSGRDEGNLWPFQRLPDGRYDLDAWNEEYWDRLRDFLRMTHEREIIPQIEVWAFHDFFSRYGSWENNPWNPRNNVNYTYANTTLGPDYPNPREPHDFFFTVPALAGDSIVLGYQRRFIERIVEIASGFDHVLYGITNEIHPAFSPEWGWYWAEFIKERAAERGRTAYVTEMFWDPDMRAEQHRASLERPDVYDFFEASQNSGINRNPDPEDHWDELLYVRDQLSSSPRPINHVKIYGADTGPPFAGSTENAIEKFWRNVFAGAAAVRFHRPPTGIGLSEVARHNIRSMRMVTDSLDVFRSVPMTDRVGERESNEAFAFGEPGGGFAVFFPGPGDVVIPGATGDFRVSWLAIDESAWEPATLVQAAGELRLRTPSAGNWVALVRPAYGSARAPSPGTATGE